jgi:hypothetical protein
MALGANLGVRYDCVSGRGCRWDFDENSAIDGRVGRRSPFRGGVEGAGPNAGSKNRFFRDLSREYEIARAGDAARLGNRPVEVLKALKDGEHSAKDLIPLVGNSASEFLTVSNQLVELGWVRRLDGDVLQLTDKGREIAELLR